MIDPYREEAEEREELLKRLEETADRLEKGIGAEDYRQRVWLIAGGVWLIAGGVLLLLALAAVLPPYSASAPGAATLADLRVAPRTHAHTYARADWGAGWPDRDGDCRDTRADLLQQTSLSAVTYTAPHGCRVVTGLWKDPWQGTTYTDAGALAIDHHVPLRLAHVAGGAAWSPAQRAAYYRNEMAVPGALQVISARTNRQKGARGPEEWRPHRHSSWCSYAQAWVAVKAFHDLSVTLRERTALAEMLDTC